MSRGIGTFEFTSVSTPTSSFGQASRTQGNRTRQRGSARHFMGSRCRDEARARYAVPAPPRSRPAEKQKEAPRASTARTRNDQEKKQQQQHHHTNDLTEIGSRRDPTRARLALQGTITARDGDQTEVQSIAIVDGMAQSGRTSGDPFRRGPFQGCSRQATVIVGRGTGQRAPRRSFCQCRKHRTAPHRSDYRARAELPKP